MAISADRKRLIALDDMQKAFYLLDEVYRDVEGRLKTSYGDRVAASDARRAFEKAYDVLLQQLELL